MKGRMQWAADAVTIVVGVAVLVVLGLRFIDHGERLETAKLDSEAVGVEFAAANRTLLLVLRSDCPYCERSKPFYARLAAARLGVQIAIAAPEGDAGIAVYSEILDPDVVVFPNREALPVGGTPTLLLVDREGAVEAAWIGLLDARREEEVMTALAG